MLEKLHAFFNPEEFRGWNKKRNYFEGWYFKLVSPDESQALAIIPGIAMDGNGEAHAFIQVLDGKKATATYHKFPIQDFVPTPRRFHIEVGNNVFSKDRILVNLPGHSLDMQMKDQFGWPKPFYSPGIMGPYSFAPFMECYHGIVSMDHVLLGTMILNGTQVNMTGGRGYTEKDWGRSFPAAYFWMQSNHFEKPGISFKCSVALIPWRGRSFVGFIGGLLLEGRLYRFTTYNGTRLLRSEANMSRVRITLQNNRYLLEVVAHRDKVTELASPIQGFMNGRIEESMSASIDIRLTDRKNKAVVFKGQGRNAGLEVAGDIPRITVVPTT